MRSLPRALAVTAFFATLLSWAAWPWLPGAGAKPPRTLVFYGFSILGETMTEDVFPAFERHWKEQTGEDLEIVSSFGGSGTITNQVALGVPAEVVLLSLELDAQRLAAAHVIEKDAWRSLPHEGVLNRTPFVIVVRPGNPKGIASFDDLAREGVSIVHPDPRTSGAANWAILAEYGAGERAHPGGGRDMLRGIWRNVTSLAGSARAARTQFENGYGDALVTYEQEILDDRRKGKRTGDVVYPASTVMSEHVLVVIPRNVPRGDEALVRAFVGWLWSPEAQSIMERHGFRRVIDGPGASFQAIGDPFTVASFGGWATVKRDIVDATWKQAVMKELGR